MEVLVSFSRVTSETEPKGGSFDRVVFAIPSDEDGILYDLNVENLQGRDCG